MITLNTEKWLEEFQRDFSRSIRTPLDRENGQLRARVDKYAPTLVTRITPTESVASLNALAIYNRQYWFRLYTTFQGEFPLVARLLGYWNFNAVAEHYLLEHPPTAPELHLIGCEFPDFLARHRDLVCQIVPTISHKLNVTCLVDAAYLDAAWSRVFLAPEEAAWQPTPDEASRLMDLQLQPAKRWYLIHQDWPLVQLRHRLTDSPGEAALPPPARLHRSEWWLLRQVDAGIEQLCLDRLQAELYKLLTQHPLGHALARFETLDASAANATEKVTTWLQASMHWGLWSAAQ